MVDTDINRDKGTKSVDYILKPDSEEYDPFKFLDYDAEEHIFLPKIDLETNIYK